MLQFSGGRKPSVGIVYDSDLGTSIDSVLALALLHGLESKTQARIASLTISNSNFKAAQLCDVIEKYYSSAITGLAATFFASSPIGLATDNKGSGVPVAAALLDKKDDSGKPVYTPRLRNVNDTAVPEVLMRNALTAQYDENGAVVLAGPATNLVRLLDLTGARALIQAKVKMLVVAGDAVGRADLPAAKRLFAEWPTPIILAGAEVGAALPFPASSIETDFAYSPIQPIAAAYRAYKPMPYDARTTAMSAVMYAARAKEAYFQVSEPGTITVGADGRVAFAATSGGKHRSLTVDPAHKEEILKLYTTLASVKPMPRTFRALAAAADDANKADKTEKPDKTEKKDPPEKP